MKEGCMNSKIVHARSRLIKLLKCKYMIPIMKKEGWLRGLRLEPRSWSQESQKWPRNQMEFACWISKLLGTNDPFSFIFSPLLNRNFYNCYVMPVSPLCFGAENLFTELHRIICEMNYASGWIIPRWASFVLDLIGYQEAASATADFKIHFHSCNSRMQSEVTFTSASSHPKKLVTRH